MKNKFTILETEKEEDITDKLLSICERNNGNHTSHCERRHNDKSSPRTAHARCRRANTTMTSDRQICYDPWSSVRRRFRESGDGPTVYVNEDLTRRRAALDKKTRQRKKLRKINDCCRVGP